MLRTLILVRHAHRDNSQRQLDNGLSEKGQKQAKWIRDFMKARQVKTGWESKEGWLLSSSKKRCLETLQPIAQMMDMKVQTRSELMEQVSGETFGDFEKRVDQFLSWWSAKGPEWTIVCTHGDWLPVATHRLLGLSVDFKKGAWFEIESDKTHNQLRWYVPTFKYFNI